VTGVKFFSSSMNLMVFELGAPDRHLLRLFGLGDVTVFHLL